MVMQNDCRSVGAGSKPARYRQIYMLQSGGFRTRPYSDTLNIPINHHLIGSLFPPLAYWHIISLFLKLDMILIWYLESIVIKLCF